MKYILYIFTISLLITSSCIAVKEKDKSQIISVSILPQKYLLDKITGGKYEVNVLIPTGASPASYEPSPRQILQLVNSDIYFRIGEIVFEKTWIEKISQQNPELKIINLSEGIKFIEAEEHRHSDEKELAEESDHSEHRHGKDPHIWMSPKIMKNISGKILEDLNKIYPSDSLLFDENYNSLMNELDYIDSLYSSSTDILSGMNFLIYHPALAYLAQDYNMTQHVLEFEGKEPGPTHIASIIDLARELNIEFIFVQRQFSLDNAKSFANEIGAEIISIDPLAENWYEQLINIHQILISK